VRERLLAYARGKSPDEPVFRFAGRSAGYAAKIFTKAAAILGHRLGMTDEELKERHIVFYSGRHFWKTLMNYGGLGEDAEEFFMGHKVSGDVAKRYNHLDMQGKDVMVKKAKKIFAILDKFIFADIL